MHLKYGQNLTQMSQVNLGMHVDEGQSKDWDQQGKLRSETVDETGTLILNCTWQTCSCNIRIPGGAVVSSWLFWFFYVRAIAFQEILAQRPWFTESRNFSFPTDCVCSIITGFNFFLIHLRNHNIFIKFSKTKGIWLLRYLFSLITCINNCLVQPGFFSYTEWNICFWLTDFFLFSLCFCVLFPFNMSVTTSYV